MLTTADPGAVQGRHAPDRPSEETIAALKQAKVDLLDRLNAIHANAAHGLDTEETVAAHIKEAYAEFEARIQRLLEDESDRC